MLDSKVEKAYIKLIKKDARIISQMDGVTEEMVLVAINSIQPGTFLNQSKEEVTVEELLEIITLLSNNKDRSNVREDITDACLKKNGLFIKQINDATEEQKLLAVTQRGYSLQHIENPSNEVVMTALKNDGGAMTFVENPTEEMLITALKSQYGDWESLLKKITGFSEPICLALIEKSHGHAIDSIPNASDEMKIIAIRKNPLCFNKIHYPSQEVLWEFIKHQKNQKDNNILGMSWGDGFRDSLTETSLMYIVSKGASEIAYLQDHEKTEDVIKAALAADPVALGNMDNPTTEHTHFAICKNPCAIYFVKEPSENTIRMAEAHIDCKKLLDKKWNKYGIHHRFQYSLRDK